MDPFVKSPLDRFNWEHGVLACPDFTDGEARVLIRLARHMDVRTLRLDPGVHELARGANQSPRKVIATISKAEKLGWINRTIGGGRGHTNSYRLVLRNLETLHEPTGFALETLNACVEDPERPGNKPCSGVQLNRKNRNNRNAEARKAPAAETEEAAYFRRGKEVLGSSAGGLLASLKKHRGGSVPLARATIETASTKENPREYVARILLGQPTGPPERGIINARATGII
jgi:hypothetical protein